MAASSETGSVGALLKGFAIIEQLSNGQTSLSDIARRTGLPKSSTFRLLATLTELGVVSRGDQDDSYQLTPKLFEYGASAIQAFSLVDLAKHDMRLIRDHTGESVYLSVRSQTKAVCLYNVDAHYSLRLHHALGMAIPLYATATGKSLLAWLSGGDIRSIVSRITFRRFSPGTITDPAAFIEHLDLVKRRGYAIDHAEHEPDVLSFAMPVFDHYGSVAASMGVALPLSRYAEDKGAVILATLHQASRSVSTRLGCRTYPIGPPAGPPRNPGLRPA